jgi:hypothetical protein
MDAGGAAEALVREERRQAVFGATGVDGGLDFRCEVSLSWTRW